MDISEVGMNNELIINLHFTHKSSEQTETFIQLRAMM